MAKAAYWALCAYLVLKLIQYFIVPRSGFGDIPTGLRQALLRGEPVLLIVACAVSVPPALWTTRHHQRGYEGELARSVDCYGKLRAVSHLTAVETGFNAIRVFRATRHAKWSAATAAHSLELAPAFVDSSLAGKTSFYRERYSSLSKRGDLEALADEADAIERCMSGPLLRV